MSLYKKPDYLSDPWWRVLWDSAWCDFWAPLNVVGKALASPLLVLALLMALVVFALSKTRKTEAK